MDPIENDECNDFSNLGGTIAKQNQVTYMARKRGL